MKTFAQFDGILITAVALLVGVSLLELYSISLAQGAAGGFVVRQGVFALLAFAVMAFLARLDYRVLRRRHMRWLYFAVIAALVAVLLIGTNVRGTVGWIVVGPFSLQVVEFVKVAMVLFMASFIAAKQTLMGPGVRMMVSLVLMGVVVALVLAQPDFGSAMTLVALWFGMLVVSGLPRRYLVATVLAGVALAGLTWFVLAPYQRDRVLAFVNPYSDPHGSGYNVIQAMTAVGAGGVTGKGLGHGTQTQLGFLPESHTDFIFAVIAEEFGLLGALFVIVLYGIMLVRLWRIALRAPTNFSYLVVSGVMVMFFVHILVNIGMNLGIMPVTGIPLPFVSYGGSSLLAGSIALGLVLSIDHVARRMRGIV